MDLLQIVVLVLLLILIIYFIVWIFSTSTQLTNMSDAKISQTIVAKTLPVNNNTSNYTYSTWIFVNDWNYRYGQDKVILQRLDKDQKPSPSITLGAMENTLKVRVNYYATSNSGSSSMGDEEEECPDDGAAAEEDEDEAEGLMSSLSGRTSTHTCQVENIPLQKWVNILISLYGRTLDVYIDGKLVRTCVLPGVAKPNAEADIQVTPRGGFSGFTTNFQYWPASSNPQEAYDIYKQGLGGSILSSMLNKFRIRFTFLADNEEKGSFEI
jgi:hypothetical protein